MATKNFQPGAGNVEIVLGDDTLILKPTLNAALAISRTAGGIRGAIDKVAAMDFDAITSVIRLGIGTEEAKRRKDLDRMIYENGLYDAQGEVMGKCIEFLSNLARGGKPADAVKDENSEEGNPTI